MAVMLNKKKPQPKLGSPGYYQSRALPIPKLKPPPQPKPQPAWKPLQGQMRNVFGNPNPYAGEQAAIGYGWSKGLGELAGVQTGGGGALVQPSYAGMIGGDWEVQDAEAAMGARLASLRGDFTSGIRQALVDLGVTDTSKLGGFGQYIDADTIAKAAQNKYSTSAQVAAAERRAQRQSRAALAAKGILSSGQTTKSEGDIAAQAESKRYDALRSFLETGTTGLRTIADEEYQLARGVAQARAAAAARAAEWGAMGGMGGGDYGYSETVGGAPVPAPARAPSLPALRPGFVRGTQGQYMSRPTFLQQRPGGNYQNYLAYLRKARGGRL